MTALRFILIGLGARSRIWRRVLKEHPDCSLVGLVDTDPDRLAVIACDLADGGELLVAPAAGANVPGVDPVLG